MSVQLGGILRCHVRTKPLAIAINEFFRYGRELGIDVGLSILSDRPTTEVSYVLNRAKAAYGDQVRITGSHIEVLGGGKQRWMSSNSYNTSLVEEAFDPEWIYFMDDDRWFEPDKILPALFKALTSDEDDVWTAESLFFWDKPDQINRARHHHQAVLWRHVRDERFCTHRELQVPYQIYDEAIMTGRIADIGVPLLDYGSYDAAERKRVYEAYIAAGRNPNDPWISSLIAPPEGALEKYVVNPDLWSQADAKS